MAEVKRLESPEQRRQLLRVARQSAEKILGVAAAPPGPSPEIEGRFGGAFVTFWAGKRLRGCVGSFALTDDIVRTVEHVTHQSLSDSRFRTAPVTAEELASLEIEVSVLSDLEPTDYPASLVPGVHGIVIRRGVQSGCFLPKVAEERGWSAEEFLSSCCTMKAGLPADAWRRPDTEVLLFTADVFSESQYRA